jgi:hypothetical protein
MHGNYEKILSLSVTLTHTQYGYLKIPITVVMGYVIWLLVLFAITILTLP